MMEQIAVELLAIKNALIVIAVFLGCILTFKNTSGK